MIYWWGFLFRSQSARQSSSSTRRSRCSWRARLDSSEKVGTEVLVITMWRQLASVTWTDSKILDKESRRELVCKYLEESSESHPTGWSVRASSIPWRRRTQDFHVSRWISHVAITERRYRSRYEKKTKRDDTDDVRIRVTIESKYRRRRYLHFPLKRKNEEKTSPAEM